MHEQVVNYSVEGTNCKGFLVYDETVKERKPGILIAHAYKGLDAFAKDKARELAKLGYVAFAADNYGEGKTVATAEEARQLMLPLFVDRATLRKRIAAALETFKKQPQVDSDNIGAIGFCFGGLTVIELLRSGTGCKGAVSFHGVLGSTLGETQAKLEPNHYTPHTSLLILNGYEDTMVPEKDISSIEKELNEAQIDWQLTTYGHSKHAFMVPTANEGVFKYNPVVAKRAWQAMELFFNEILIK